MWMQSSYRAGAQGVRNAGRRSPSRYCLSMRAGLTLLERQPAAAPLSVILIKAGAARIPIRPRFLMPETIQDRVLRVIATTQRLPQERVTPESSLEELGID